MLDYIEAHKYSMNHHKELERDTKCGCFYCLKIFNPKKSLKGQRIPQELQYVHIAV